MKGRIADDLLDRLGEEWLAVQLDPHTLPEWLETPEGPRPMSEDMWRLARKVREDVAAVHAALLAEEPSGSPAVEGVPSLSATNVAVVEHAASSSAPQAGRSRRSHYLYWLLCRLEALGVLTFTLPVRARELPPRALGFDALDPHLPLPTRFCAWQRHLASRSLDVRPLKDRKETSDREREYLTLVALFAFGGPCGRGALATAARIRVEDVDLASGTLWLRNSSGDRILNLTLHPVHLLALHLHLRVLKSALDCEDTSEVDTGKAVFPSAGTKGRQKAFRRWVELELEIADAASGTGGPHAARASLKALLAGAHRWAFEIYPVYLASLLAGRFSSTVLDGGRGERRRRRRRGEDDPDNVPPSAEERELRSQLHLSAVEFFERMGSVGRVAVGHLRDDWGRIVRPPGVAVPPHDRSAEARSWNLFLLSRALVRMLYDGEASSYSTLARWLFTGYTLLDGLGGRPGWMMADGERENLASGFARRDKRLLELTLDGMTEEAKHYRLEALPLLASAAASSEAESHSARANGGRHARQVPTLEQIDGMARRLDEALRLHRRKNSAAPLDVLLYMDLLAVGARKSEALNVKARHVVDAGGGSDLIIRGGKTAAAYRLVPLDGHPNRGGAGRIAEAGHRVEDKREWQNLIEAAGGIKYERYKRPEKGQVSRYFSADRLDYALRELGRRVGIDGLSPHDLRRASITACLLAGVPPELIAKYHGHEDLPTTFEHYVFGLSAVQARDLSVFLSREENQVWVAITDAVQLLHVTKVAVYKRYSPENSKVRVIDSPDAPGLVLKCSGVPRYVRAADLADHVRCKDGACPRTTKP